MTARLAIAYRLRALSSLSGSARGDLSWLVGGGAAAVVAVGIALRVPVEVAALGVLVAVTVALRRPSQMLLLAVAVVPFLGLLRRLLAGDSGRIDFDPLAAGSLILFAIPLVVTGLDPGVFTGRERRPGTRWVLGAAAMLIAAVVTTMLLRLDLAPTDLFFAATTSAPFVAVAMIASGRLPDVWGTLRRYIPPAALVAGVYGVVQFTVLPVWDRRWMIASGLTSIGAPYPLQVRVFGTSEAPGPFAAFLGLGLVVALCNATVSRGPRRIIWFTFVLALVIPLILTGVRAALLAAAVVAIALALVRGRGLGRVLPVALVVVAYFVVGQVTDSLSGTSSILSDQRYGGFDPDTDASLQARLGLFTYLARPFSYLIGSPGIVRLDNFMIDNLVAYGLVACVASIAIWIGFMRIGFRQLSNRGSDASVAAGTLFILIFCLAGDIFTSSFGFMAAIVLGSGLRRWYALPVDQLRLGTSSTLVLADS